jgi:hypothetical protein
MLTKIIQAKKVPQRLKIQYTKTVVRCTNFASESEIGTIKINLSLFYITVILLTSVIGCFMT